MPGSTIGFGHDTHGVNIQNLRSLTSNPSRKSLSPNHRTVQEWKRDTKETLNLASAENNMSRSLRNASKKLQEQLKTKTEKDLCKVEKALKSKLSKTGRLKSVLEMAISSTQDEKLKLMSVRNKVLAKQQKTSKQLALCEARVKVRFNRPNKEIVNDKVQLQLQRQTGILQTYRNRLHRGVQIAEAAIARLEKCVQALSADLNDKVTALELDTQVLEGDFSTSKVPKNCMGDVQGLHPHNWNQSTEDFIQEANKWGAESNRIRHELQNLMNEKDAAARECYSVLNTVMIEKLNETDEARQTLQSKYAETKRELEEAKQRRSALEQSLEEKKEPTLKAMQRLLIRQQRPPRERVDDEAHKALVIELRNLTSISSQLQEKIKTMDRDIKKLEEKMCMIDENLRGKSAGWKVDEQCILMDGRTTVSRCPSSVGTCSNKSGVSNKSLRSDKSVKSDIMSRISHLENELTLARKDRIGIEANVHKLQEEASNHSGSPS